MKKTLTILALFVSALVSAQTVNGTFTFVSQTDAAWATENRILAIGEFGHITDGVNAGRWKQGNGSSTFGALPWTMANIGTFGMQMLQAVNQSGAQTLIGPLSFPSTVTWATKPLSPATGSDVIITDIGPAYSRWFWNGSAWKPINGSIVLSNLANPLTSTLGATEQIRTSVVIPAGLMQQGAVLRVSLSARKSGVAETSTVRLRMGALGTIVDPIHLALPMATTVDGFGGQFELKRSTATGLLRTGAGANSVLNPMQFSNATQTTAVTVANMDALSNTITITTQHSASAETTTIDGLTIELICP